MDGILVPFQKLLKRILEDSSLAAEGEDKAHRPLLAHTSHSGAVQAHEASYLACGQKERPLPEKMRSKLAKSERSPLAFSTFFTFFCASRSFPTP